MMEFNFMKIILLNKENLEVFQANLYLYLYLQNALKTNFKKALLKALSSHGHFLR